MEKVVVVIPALNEQTTIRSVVESVRALGYPVLVVNDGSGDDTADEAHIGGAEVINSVGNYGVGAALSWGVSFAEKWMQADIIAIMDADAQHDPRDIPSLVAALDGCDLVNGSRFLGSVDGMPFHRRIMLKFVYFVMWMLTGVEVTDPLSGLKCFKPETFRIRSHRFSWAAELIWRTAKHGRIREVPAHMKYTEYSKNKGQKSRHVFRVGLELVRSLKGD